MQVVIALIVTPDGFPLAYEVLPGNTSDKTTLRDLLAKIESPIRQGQAHLGDGPRHSDRGGAGRDARGRYADPLSGGHAARAADQLEKLLDQAVGARCARACGSNWSNRTANSTCWRTATPAATRNTRCGGAG